MGKNWRRDDGLAKETVIPIRGDQEMCGKPLETMSVLRQKDKKEPQNNLNMYFSQNGFLILLQNYLKTCQRQ